MTETKTKTKVDEATNAELASDKASSKDEKNSEEKVNTQYSILFNGQTIKFDEKFGTTEADKLGEAGISIQKNGDIIILSGSGGKGKACAGRLLVNTKNGQLIKSGPIVIEATAERSSPTNDGSTTPEDVDQVAYSGYFSGDHEMEVQGTYYLKARDIVLDATDTLTLKGTKVIVAADEWVEDTGLHKSIVNSVDQVVTSQKSATTMEETSFQYDPRASVNVVSGGSMNIKAVGDISLGATGVMETLILGKPVSVPLVKISRESAYSVKTALLPISLDAATLCSIKAATAFNVLAGADASIIAGGSANINAGISASLLGHTNVNMIATEGNVNLISVLGNVNVKGLMIYLN